MLTPFELLLRRVSHRGERREWRFNPLWTKLRREADDEFGLQRLCAHLSRRAGRPRPRALAAGARDLRGGVRHGADAGQARRVIGRRAAGIGCRRGARLGKVADQRTDPCSTRFRDITIEPAALTLPDGPAGDYERVRRIIAFISERWRDQPSLEAIAEHVGLSTTHVHHLFRRWCGLTPKAFLQAITLDNAKALLADSASVLDATYEVGLSGPGPPARPLRHPRGDDARRLQGAAAPA